MYCCVYHCNHPYSHNYLSHLCKKCNTFGHGIKECGNIEQINKLKEMSKEFTKFPNMCNIATCTNKSNHLTSGHICETCKKPGHDCNEIFDNKVICISRKAMKNTRGRIMVKFYHGGCKYTIVKRNALDEQLDVILLKYPTVEKMNSICKNYRLIGVETILN